MSHNLFEEITQEDNIEQAYKDCMAGKSKYKTDAMIFDRDKTFNLNQLVESLKDGTYQMDEYLQFYVYEPKERKIFAPRFKDKLIQLMINNVIKKIYFPSFIFDSYACIDDKGTHKASDRISHFLRKSSWEYGEEAFIIKFDVSKFFYSIDRDILKGLLPKKIKCKQTVQLIDKIIDSSPGDIGLPLGNITSHILANVYMNELDQYCKRNLGLKYYVRYMDDSFVVVKNKEEANRVMNLMINFIETKLNLIANPKKTRIFPIEQGVNIVGFKTYKTHKLLRDDSKRKVKRKLRKMERLIRSERMTVEKAEQMLNSWLGHSRNASSKNFVYRLLLKHDFLILNHKSIFKIMLKEDEIDAEKSR